VQCASAALTAIAVTIQAQGVQDAFSPAGLLCLPHDAPLQVEERFNPSPTQHDALPAEE
jgi:hypothetical protein